MKTKNAIILMFISLLFINCKQSKECEKTNTEMDKTSKKTKVMKLISENTKPGESNVTLEDVALLKKTIFFSKDDEANLKLAGEVLKDQIEDVLDVWYGYVGSNEHLLYYFNSPRYICDIFGKFTIYSWHIHLSAASVELANFGVELAKYRHIAGIFESF